MLDKAIKFILSIAGTGGCDLDLHDLMKGAVFHADITRHPYGFYIWRVPWPNSTWQLRIHLWLPEKRLRQSPDWPVHTHNGQLHSFVLEGAVNNHDYVFHEDSEGIGAVYDVTYKNPTSILTKTLLRGSISETRSSTIVAGQNYLVDRNRFHASEIDAASLSITIVLMEMHQSTNSYVFGEANGPNELRFDRKGIAPDEITKIRRVLETKVWA